MQLYLESRRKKMETIQKCYPDAAVVDLTSKGLPEWRTFSPFYPHGDIPVPLSPGYFAASVEGIWQGLKVFETEGIDLSRFKIVTMKGIKRTVRQYGRVLGHQKGIDSDELLPYVTARKLIYIPAYHWVLGHKLQAECDHLLSLARQQTLVLLDYETNADVDDPRKPLSHASLVIDYLRGVGT